jgi:hypothetical protein
MSSTYKYTIRKENKHYELSGAIQYQQAMIQSLVEFDVWVSEVQFGMFWQ